jgi:hypothetical protein
MDQKQEKEQRDWTGYGSAKRPAVIVCSAVHAEAFDGTHGTRNHATPHVAQNREEK